MIYYHGFLLMRTKNLINKGCRTSFPPERKYFEESRIINHQTISSRAAIILSSLATLTQAINTSYLLAIKPQRRAKCTFNRRNSSSRCRVMEHQQLAATQ